MAQAPSRARLSAIAALGLLLSCTSGEAPADVADGAVATPATNDVGVRDAAPVSGDVATTEAGPELVCPVPAAGPTTDAAPPSFTDQIFPLLNGGCGRFSCHNDAFRTSGLFLGPSPDEYPPDAASAAEAYASLLDTSRIAPSVARVEPGAPERSFLMLKLDGCQGLLGIDCPASTPQLPCGSQMPLASDPWSSERRDLVRAWIAAGAHGP